MAHEHFAEQQRARLLLRPRTEGQRSDQREGRGKIRPRAVWVRRPALDALQAEKLAVAGPKQDDLLILPAQMIGTAVRRLAQEIKAFLDNLHFADERLLLQTIER